jgi:lipopolysaccharide export system protein LptC
MAAGRHPARSKANKATLTDATGPATDLHHARHDAVVTPTSRAEAFRRAQRHSRRVRLLKILLPVSAVAVAGAFISASWLDEAAEAPVEATSAAFSEGKLVMANPKLEGMTSANLPYTMTAGRAVQDSLASGLYQLDDIDAKLPIGGGVWATVDASGAVFDRDKNTIEFKTGLALTTTDGLAAQFKSAIIDVGNGGLTTSEPVDIQLASGMRVSSESMTVLENGKILIFENRVRLQMKPPEMGAASNASGGENGG